MKNRVEKLDNFSDIGYYYPTTVRPLPRRPGIIINTCAEVHSTSTLRVKPNRIASTFRHQLNLLFLCLPGIPELGTFGRDREIFCALGTISTFLRKYRIAHGVTPKCHPRL